MFNSSAKHLMIILCFVLLIAVPSCQRLHLCRLSCRSEYLYPQYLASFQVNTPDEGVRCFYGQQIIVAWNLPRKCLEKPIFLNLSIRYGDREICTVSTPIKDRWGKWIYRLVGKDYWCKNGIISYQARIEDEKGNILDEWSHFLWAEIIEINPDDF